MTTTSSLLAYPHNTNPTTNPNTTIQPPPPPPPQNQHPLSLSDPKPWTDLLLGLFTRASDRAYFHVDHVPTYLVSVTKTTISDSITKHDFTTAETRPKPDVYSSSPQAAINGSGAMRDQHYHQKTI
jgi:hypothetical protein